MKTPQQAWELLASVVSPGPTEIRPLAQAAGRYLAAAVRAELSFPPAPVAAMDGYAVRCSEAAGRGLPVALTVKAGDPPQVLPPATCARIFTGALVPEGADAVVAQEVVELAAGQVRFPAAIPKGANIRHRGEVFAEGGELLPPGTRLTAVPLALLAAAGLRRVPVVAEPRVGLLVTGSELTTAKPRPGQIVDSNTPMLQNLLAGEPVRRVRPQRVPDELPRLRQALSQALQEAQVVITTGGVSVGELDLLPQALAELGTEVLFHKVAMQPGKPILVARHGASWLVGLPGNSVSALVGFRLFARPLLRALAGDRQAFSGPWIPLPLAKAARNPGQRTQFRPARLCLTSNGVAVEVLPWKGSHDLRAAAFATHLAQLEPGVQEPPGALVPVLPLA